MTIRETKLKGAFIIEPERFPDERGFFARAWSEGELARYGIGRLVEGNISYNAKKGTLRGMHFQAAPHGQAKLLRCTRGAVFDVGVDLRPESPTFKQWVGVELTEETRVLLYLPPEFGHGFQTLADDTEVFYMVSSPYAPGASGGVRWDDPAFRIEWPHAEARIINERDRTYPDFTL